MQFFQDVLARAMAGRRSANLYRQRRVVPARQPAHVRIEGRPLIDFSSNDYLGLTRHPRMVETMREAISRDGAGSGASALVSGYTERHASAERALAQWKKTEDAVTLPSGYQTSHALVQTLCACATATDTRIRFLFDKLAHASLIDAVTGSGQAFRVFGHNDVDRLEKLLRDDESETLQVVITESIFSMDGDSGDLERLVALKRRRRFVLVLDEAHASGVYGPQGSGYAAERGFAREIDAFIVTMSKGMGCSGGAICGSGALCEAVVNFGRAYIYTTAVVPAIAAGCEAAIAIMRDEPQRQARVRQLARRVREKLSMAGVQIPPGDSPIVPIILGDEQAALTASAALLERGMLVSAIRPPTVKHATSRLRVTLSSEHSDQQVDQLIEACKELRPEAEHLR